MGSAGWEWVRRIRNSECGIARVETARGRIVVFQYKKRLWWALFIDAIFCIEMCGYPENLSLWRRNSCINTRALYAVVTNPIARKGVQRGEDPLGSSINTRKLYANVPNSIARKGQGRNSLAGSRGSAPWVTHSFSISSICQKTSFGIPFSFSSPLCVPFIL